MYFNPRTPRGVRRASPLPLRLRHPQFQSTHPARGATIYPHPTMSIHRNFNPRTPRGVRPTSVIPSAKAIKISIHAPREGCDRRLYIHCILLHCISIHAPREGCDGVKAGGGPSARRISIHAPREGCDKQNLRHHHRIYNFNPRTPRGVRLSIDNWWLKGNVQFQSTHPARGATWCSGAGTGQTDHFNPRTPRGVRLSLRGWRGGQWSISIHAPREGCDALCLLLYMLNNVISIHAPREGCDSKLYQRAESLLGSICLFAQGEEG